MIFVFQTLILSNLILNFVGEFGDVYKGEIKLPGHPATKVAIKTLKVMFMFVANTYVILKKYPVPPKKN